MKEIPLTQGKVTLVDDEDYEYLIQWKWYALKNKATVYAVRTVRRGVLLYMHREIMKPLGNDVVDHINFNGLDNQKHNLRTCTSYQNCLNRKPHGASKYLGVSPVVVRSRTVLKNGEVKIYQYHKFLACITTNGKYRELGKFKSQEEAARTYDKAARIYHGEFANLNFK